ncbi:MAG: hypothetical protein Tsb009_03420 [Planctomycetaceae bacterium]
MKFRNSGGENEKIEPEMAPMIDVVFQLLIFFMLTLKIIEPEGDFSINMPQGKPSQTQNDKVDILPKYVSLQANPDGTLKSLLYGAAARSGRSFAIIPERDPQKIEQYQKLNAKENLSFQEAARRMGEDVAFKQLNNEIAKWVRQQRQLFASGNSQADREKFEKQLKIKLVFDYHLHNRYIIKATSACRGQLVPGSDRPRDLVKNIEFIKPDRPKS